METQVCKVCGQELPITAFRHTAFGYRKTCDCCVTNKIQQTKNEKKATQQREKLGLAAYSPRQLMEELKRRGYTGTLRFVETHVIDLDKI